MEQLITNTSEFNMPLFLINNARREFEPFKQSRNIFLTQQGNVSLKEEILKLITNAKSVIKICSFIITDKEIYEAILSKSRNSDVAIFILTQLDEKKLKTSDRDDLLTIEEIQENSNQVHFNCIKSLFDNGVHIRASEFAHAKFMIVDRSVAFITSANLTTPSLILNTELGLYTGEEDAVRFDKLFDLIFTKGTKYRKYISASKKKMFVVQSDSRIEVTDLPNSDDTKMRYTYEFYVQSLYQELVNITNRANKFLYISTYSIVGLNNLNELVTALQAAFKRGVNIKIFCRGMNYRADHLSGCKTLLDLGCKLYADVYNHSKGILSESEAMVFTANIDGRNGLKNGFEIGYILNGSDREEYLMILESLIDSSFYTFSQKPKRIDFFKTYQEYENLKGITVPELPDEITIEYGQQLGINLNEISGGPIFFSKNHTETLLYIKSRIYRCVYDAGVFSIKCEEAKKYNSEKYLLKYNNLKIIHHNER